MLAAGSSRSIKAGIGVRHVALPPSSPSSRVQEQIGRAYRQMVRFYRPAASSDGFGNVTVPVRELDLAAECSGYAATWLAARLVGESGQAEAPDKRRDCAMVR